MTFVDPTTARSRNMSLVRARNTQPEMIVRRAAHSLGYRFRLHDTTLPGTPDIVFRRRKKVIFVHGCFWHQHQGCKRSTIPKSRTEYWIPKLQHNKAQDQTALTQQALKLEAELGRELINSHSRHRSGSMKTQYATRTTANSIAR
jgi:DNA mismatch endonuclease, patch repair protein